MATGNSGSFTLSGTLNFSAKIDWIEEYDVSTNSSVINIYLSIMSGWYAGTFKLEGSISVAGSNIVTMKYADNYSVNTNYNTGNWISVSTKTGNPWQSITISHDNSGTASTTISINNLSGYRSDGGTDGNGFVINGSKTVDLITIPRASNISSVDDADIGSACNVKWTPLSTSFCYKLRFSLGTWSATTNAIKPNTTSPYTYTGYIIANAAANQLPNTISGIMTVILYTYSNDDCTEQIGATSSKTFTVHIPSSMIPTINTVNTVIDNSENSVVSGWGIAVAGYTKVKVAATASGSYSSTISSFTISDGYSVTKSGTSLSYTGGIITSSGSKTFGIVAKDSRGRTSAKYTTDAITFYAYSKPIVSSFSAARSSSDQSKVVVQGNWDFSSVNNKNSATGTLYYKKSTDTSWINYGTISKNIVTTLDMNFDITISYNFKLVVTDALSNSAQDEAFISTIEVLLDFRAGGKGLGIGKICESDSMEVSLDAKFFGAVYINGVTLEEYIRSIVG